MNTMIIKIDQENIDKALIEKAGSILREGGLVAFPTETVYGIGADALNEMAVEEIFYAKGRPSDNPLIIHIGKKEDVFLYAKDIPEAAHRLMSAFWPGPLTLVLKKLSIIPDIITGGLDTVAIRMPANPIAKGIILASGCPIAAPSANRSGRPSPTEAGHVIEDLTGRVDMIIDGGSTLIGLESTVLDLTTDIPLILRPGGITYQMLQRVLGQVEMDKALHVDSKEAPKSPGMKYTHYAPKGHLMIVSGLEDKAISQINHMIKDKEAKGIKTAVIATHDDIDKNICNNRLLIGSRNNPEEIAANLFRVLRLMDEIGAEFIYSRDFIEEGIGTATMNRLMKAAGGERLMAE